MSETDSAPKEARPIFVLEGDPVVRDRLISLVAQSGFEGVGLADPHAALDRAASEEVLLVVTDAALPDMDGLTFQRYLWARRPDIPVIVTARFPEVSLAVEAIRNGAADFILKPLTDRQVAQALERTARARVEEARNAEALRAVDSTLRGDLPSTLEHIRAVLGFITQRSLLAECWSSVVVFQIRLALDEALSNALEHGNRFDPCRRIKMEVHCTADRFEASVEDEGEGFDPRSLPDPRAEANLQALLEGGRGVFLMRCYMDGIRYNARGNQISLWRDNPHPPPGGVQGAQPAPRDAWPPLCQ